MRLLFGVGALFLLFASCRTAPEPRPMPLAPVMGTVLSQHRIELAGELAGFLVESDFPGAISERRFLVQNAFGQQIGFVDALGRAFRYRASDGEPEHVATGTMEENLKAILRLSGLPRVLPSSPN